MQSNYFKLSITISQSNRYLLDLTALALALALALGVGNVYYDKSWNGYIYYVSSIHDLTVVFEYFDKYPSLVLPKLVDVATLKQLLKWKAEGKHLPQHPHYKEFIKVSTKLTNRQLRTEAFKGKYIIVHLYSYNN